MSQQTLHKWDATGVTGYPLTHPIVGQEDFFRKFKHFLDLVRYEENRFAHVIAAVAPWGIGKSRLGYEIVAQVNGTSRGWKVRRAGGGLEDAEVFDSDEVREKHLALYIRYSQVAHEQLNLDNWFAPGLYKALEPLARAQFDGSIQHQIAKQGYARLRTRGFEADELATAMEIDQHPPEAIYADTALATRLCSGAYEVLRKYGIEYVIVVLDELETAAERAPAGLEAEDGRAMDGRAITMLRKAVETLGHKEIEAMGKAIKEEDARARFPWLRFLTLCSPAIGDELKEVQSTDRRFEIVDLARNAFSDVAAFIRSLEEERRLLRPYPPGLVEAAYMMSGGNFGWFNVIMANVDQVLWKMPEGTAPSISDVFLQMLRVSERIRRHVLDHRSIDELNLTDEDRTSAIELLFGQLPVRLGALGGEGRQQQLLALRNAYGELVATRYQQFTWQVSQCANILIQNRFHRAQGSGSWTAPGIPEAIDLERLLDDLATLAIHEAPERGAEGAHTLLLPQTLSEFLQLLDLIHPQPAVEETGRTLWQALVGEPALPEDQATHIGPSVDMLRRLDIRLRKASTGNVFRDPQESEAYERVLESLSRSEADRARTVLAGAMRLLDENWSYEAEPAGLGDGIIALRTTKEGFIDFKGLALHPKGTAVFAWANSDESFGRLLQTVAVAHKNEGRFPVVVFTSDYGLPERFAGSKLPQFEKARDYTVMLHVNSGEESALEAIGLSTSAWIGFRMRREGLTTRFSERLNRIKAPAGRRIREWRHEVSRRGGIAWPFRANGVLKEEARKTLIESWKIVMFEKQGEPLGKVGTVPGLDHAALLQVLSALGLSPSAGPKGYTAEDGSGLWVGEHEQARPEVPGFLLRVALDLFRNPEKRITLQNVRPQWLWGYTWDGHKAADIFRDWMALLVDLGWANAKEEGRTQSSYGLVPRSKLKGDLDAARNWLDKGYREVVEKLAQIVGPGVVDTYFKPPTGSKFQKAMSLLAKAQQHLEALSTLEANPPEPSEGEAARSWFGQTTLLRLRIRDLIDQVFDKDRYENLPAGLDERVLNLHDDAKPLWERLRQAGYFADAVRSVAQRIRRQVPLLREDMEKAVRELPGFPRSLFTRPLMKILDIIDLGLTGEDPGKSVHRAQQAQPYTLAYYLKELRVAEALDALENLGKEVGVSRYPAAEKPLAEVEGEVLSGFRNLKKRYADASNAIDSLTQRIETLENTLANPPLDFALPAQVSLDQVTGRPELILGELQTATDETVEELLDQHNQNMNLGNFTPLMKEARVRLLDVPERSIKALEGKVRTLENAVAKYREILVSRPELLEVREALNVLRRVRRKTEEAPILAGEIEDRSLQDGLAHVLGRLQMWKDESEGLLDGTGVALGEWQAVVAALRDGQEPSLSPQQMGSLVEAGLVKRVYALP